MEPQNIQKIAYISGGLTGLTQKKLAQMRKFYEQLGNVASWSGYTPYIPHQFSDPLQAAHLSPQEVDQIDRQAVTLAAIVIVYAGIPALGVGIELEMAYHANKPVVMLYERGMSISRLAKGNPAVKHIIEFSNRQGALFELDRFLKSYSDNPRNISLPSPLRLPIQKELACA